MNSINYPPMSELNRQAMVETPAMTGDERALALYTLNKFYGGEGDDYPARLLMAVVNAYRAGKNSMRDPLDVKPNQAVHLGYRPPRWKPVNATQAEAPETMDEAAKQYRKEQAEQLLDQRAVRKPKDVDEADLWTWPQLVDLVVAATRSGELNREESVARMAAQAGKERERNSELSDHLHKCVETLRLIQVFD
jgi:hypothetical protein